jgi:hypothetical protein
MLRISAHLTQSPIVLHPRSDAGRNEDLASLTGTVAVTTTKRRTIHGLEVLWLVCHQRRRDAKEKWGPVTQLEEYNVCLVEGALELEVGTSR